MFQNVALISCVRFSSDKLPGSRKQVVHIFYCYQFIVLFICILPPWFEFHSNLISNINFHYVCWKYYIFCFIQILIFNLRKINSFTNTWIIINNNIIMERKKQNKKQKTNFVFLFYNNLLVLTTKHFCTKKLFYTFLT